MRSITIFEESCSSASRRESEALNPLHKLELIDRIHLYFAEMNPHPVIFRWKYKMDEISIFPACWEVPKFA